jgi:hypothetical protein
MKGDNIKKISLKNFYTESAKLQIL